jgi:hypothetical protein
MLAFLLVLALTPAVALAANGPATVFTASAIEQEQLPGSIYADGQEGIGDSAHAGSSMPSQRPDSILITDDMVPLTCSGSSWCLLNLVFAMAGACLSILLMAQYATRQVIGGHSQGSGLGWRVFCSAVSVVAISAFLLTEDIYAPMEYADEWTLMMLLMFALQLTIAIVSYMRRQPA